LDVVRSNASEDKLNTINEYLSFTSKDVLDLLDSRIEDALSSM